MSKDNLYLEGFASPEGTKKFRDDALIKGISESHFKIFDELYLSSIGMGTYLGGLSIKEDLEIEDAVYESIKTGAINVIDTAINYRAMKSEKSIGRALRRSIKDGIITRDEIFISTKNGYITNDGDYPQIDVLEYMQKMYISTGIIKEEEISSGYNVLNPNYIARCVDKSLCNLKLKTLDLVYIHNPLESWNQDINKQEFFEKLYKVFEVYEKFRKENKIRYYGMATWTCFRVNEENKEYLSLEEVNNLAINVGGKDHGFRFIQLPYNLAYSEALFLKNQSIAEEKNLTILEAAKKLGIGVFSSVPLFQGRLLNSKIPEYSDNLTNQVLKLVQIIRSTPGILAPLLGQKKIEHVKENMKMAEIPLLSEEQFKSAIKILTKN